MQRIRSLIKKNSWKYNKISTKPISNRHWFTKKTKQKNWYSLKFFEAIGINCVSQTTSTTNSTIHLVHLISGVFVIQASSQGTAKGFEQSASYNWINKWFVWNFIFNVFYPSFIQFVCHSLIKSKLFVALLNNSLTNRMIAKVKWLTKIQFMPFFYSKMLFLLFIRL